MNGSPIPPVECVGCGVVFKSTYRGRKFCSMECKRAANAKRHCQVAGCENVYRAVGFCSTHYKLAFYAPEERHKVYAVACAVCGTEIMRRTKAGVRPTCSPACRAVLQFGISSGEMYDRDQAMAARARKKGATVVEIVASLDVFERDGWLCYLCGVTVSDELDCYQPTSATVDHVVSFNDGGEHSMDNCRCCCFDCNSRKDNTGDRKGRDDALERTSLSRT